MPATLGQLVQVRSRLVEELLRCLAQVADTLDQTHWVRRSGERIRASDIYVEPLVLTKERRTRRRLPGDGRDEREAIVEKRSPMDEIEAQRYERPGDVEEREEVRWRQVARGPRARVGVKGAPGSGKTFITRHAVASCGRDAAVKVEAQETGIENIEMPIWVTAKALAGAASRSIGDALIEAMEGGLELELSPRLRGLLKTLLSSPRALIVVDALDELTPGGRAGFEAKAQQLDGLKGRVIATCRTMHWEERRGWLGWRRVTEVELAPFRRRQQRQFARKFLGGHSPLVQGMDRVLRVNFPLRHACTTPLLLTFACLLHEEGKVKDDTTYAQLYAHMVRKMLSGEWRGVKPVWEADESTEEEVSEEDCLLLLDGISWELFKKAPEANRFNRRRWQECYDRTRECYRILTARRLLGELVKVGLLVPAGPDERGRECWSFVHRTFLEFLSASALSEMGERVWLNEAKRHFWSEPEWLEVLTLLVGLVDDATPLLGVLDEEQKEDDLFSSMLSLKARVIGHARDVNRSVVRRVCNEIAEFWKETWEGRRYHLLAFSLPLFESVVGNPVARGIVSERAVRWTSNPDWEGRARAAQVLGRVGDERAVQRLLQMTRDRDKWVRQAVAEALGRIGDERAAGPLLEMTRDWDLKVRGSAAEALERIGAERAVDRLVEMTRGEEWSFVAYALEALVRIPDERAVDRLLEMTRGEKWPVVGDTLLALGRIGAERAVEPLLELTRAGRALVRYCAAEALGRIGDEQAVGRLLEMTRDEDASVRHCAAEALGRIGAERAVDRLLEMAGAEDRDVRASAVAALGRIRGERALDELLEMTRDEVRRVRASAAAALGRIGGERAVDRLLEMTRDEDSSVRQVVAAALGRMGDQRAVDWLMEMSRYEAGPGRESAVEALWQIAWRHKMKIVMPEAE